MLKQRVATSTVIFFLAVFIIWFGDPWFSILLAIAASIGVVEFYRMITNSDKGHPLTYLGLLWTLALVLSPHYKNTNILPIIITSALAISLIWVLCRSSRERAFLDWAWTIAGAFYVGWMLSYWIGLNALENGRELVYLAVFTTFVNDIGAFFIGRAWGKHKLASTISPGKSWEGAIGGFLSAIIGALVIFAILTQFFTLPFAYWQVILLGCLVGIFAQLGDLVESLLKRNMGAKDSGKLLPGHGGILDRLDSVIFVGPMVYYYVIWVM